jgi:ABC-type thiamine transport system substrate-binding protein
MATSETTNLQLVKYGAGTDNFIRTDYNGNLDKIDAYAGTTNTAIANVLSNAVKVVNSVSTVAAGSSENISYPTGFTIDNCYIIGVYYTTSSTRQYKNVTASLGNSYISVTNNDTNARQIYVVLIKP